MSQKDDQKEISRELRGARVAAAHAMSLISMPVSRTSFRRSVTAPAGDHQAESHRSRNAEQHPSHLVDPDNYVSIKATAVAAKSKPRRRFDGERR